MVASNRDNASGIVYNHTKGSDLFIVYPFDIKSNLDLCNEMSRALS